MTVFLIILIIVAVFFIAGLHIVGPKDVDAVQRLGTYVGDLGEGVHWVCPFINTITKVNVATHPYSLSKVSVYSKDNVQMLISANLLYSVTDVGNFVFKNTDSVQAMIYDVRGHLRSIIGTMNSSDVIDNYKSINGQLFDAIGDLTKKYGVKVERVNLDDIVPDPEIQQALNQEKTAKQNKIAKLTKANADAQAKVTTAHGNAQAIETTADAKAYQIEKVQNALNNTGGKYFQAMAIQAYNNLAHSGNLVVYSGKNDDPTHFGGIASLHKIWNATGKTTHPKKDTSFNFNDDDGSNNDNNNNSDTDNNDNNNGDSDNQSDDNGNGMNSFNPNNLNTNPITSGITQTGNNTNPAQDNVDNNPNDNSEDNRVIRDTDN